MEKYHSTPHGRCIALDLIGMGKSDKPDIQYGFQDSYNYLEAFVDKLGLKNITLVLHDWGSGLGFHYANTHRDNIKAIAFMEAMYQAPNFNGMPLSVKLPIKMVRSKIFGGLLVKRANMFINKMLPDMINRKLTNEEMEYYASPYPDAKSRNPLLAWPRDIPMNNNPENVASKIKEYNKWLTETEIPKLCLYVKPGIGIKDSDMKIIRKAFKNTEYINLGKGLHFIQEDYPHEIGSGIANWYTSKV